MAKSRALAPRPTASRQREFRDVARTRFAVERASVLGVLRTLGSNKLSDGHTQQVVVALVATLESGPLRNAWAADLEPLVTDAVTAGGRSVAKQLGGSFDSSSRDAQNAAFRRASDVAGFVAATTVAQFLDQYRVARDSDGTAADLATLAEGGVFDQDTTDNRATLVGSLEAGVGLAIGAHLAGSLLADSKTWYHDGSPAEPRPEHEAMSGETVAVGDTFSNGLLYPRDPSGDVSDTANCTCSVAYDVSDDDAGDGDSDEDVDDDSDADAD